MNIQNLALQQSLRPKVRKLLDVVDPATEDVLTQIELSDEDDCLDALHRAAAAAPQWRATSPRARGEILRKAFELMSAEIDDLAELVVRENGKVLAEARAEVAYAAEFFRWFSEEAVRIDGDYRTAPSGSNWMLVRREPIGVSLLITPWNLPAAMVTRKVGPALAAGCTVVIKPAAETPLTAFAIADVLERAGLPEGVINIVVPDPPAAAVKSMLESGIVRKLSFTGSTATGSRLLAIASQRIVSCSMELGGNAAFIIGEGASIEDAFAGARTAKLLHGGAACIGANRFYVHESLADEFTNRLKAEFSQLIVGPGMSNSSHIGAMVSAGQRDRVVGLVNKARDRGATVSNARDIPDKGYFVAPVVVDDLDPDDQLLQQEIFGPAAPIVRWREEDDVVAWANGTPYGLASYVYGRDAASAIRIAERLEVGMVGINRSLISDPAAPFGGVKQSGLGREGGHDGILEFLETKYMAGSW